MPHMTVFPGTVGKSYASTHGLLFQHERQHRFGDCAPRRGRLARHVDHVGAALAVEMAQAAGRVFGVARIGHERSVTNREPGQERAATKSCSATCRWQRIGALAGRRSAVPRARFRPRAGRLVVRVSVHPTDSERRSVSSSLCLRVWFEVRTAPAGPGRPLPRVPRPRGPPPAELTPPPVRP